jgi:hypothetical protein
VTPYELWVSLVEKAYAKAHRSYCNINGGFPICALRDLTGAPYKEYNDLLNNKERLWVELQEAYLKKWILVCCTHSSKIKEE